jgi:HK97 family phage major capsid protein
MKRYYPWAAFAVIVAIAVVAVLACDYSAAAAHAHSGLHGFAAEGGAGAMAADQLLREFKAHNEDVLNRLKSAGVKTDELSARMGEVEQKLTQLRHGGSPVGDIADTWGAQVIRSEAAKLLKSTFKGRQRFEVKTTATLTSASGGAAGDAGALVRPDRQGGFIELPRRRLRMRNVFAPGTTTSNAIEWPRQTARSNNAATVAEGNLKPQSDMTFDMLQWPVRTVATWILASRQILDDASALQSAIDAELRFMLADVEEAQLINGLGTGTDLLGVYTAATAFSSPIVPSGAGNLTKIDVLLLAIAQLQMADYDPDFIALNPLDWADIIATKDDMGRYLGDGPFAQQAAILWTLPVVTTKSMTVDAFMVGAGQRGAQIFDRETATVELSTEDSDNFRRNLVTILAEERLAFVIKHANAFVKGTFTAALAS